MAAPKRVLVILNPTAGHGKTKKRLPQVQIALDNYGIPYEIVETERPGHATELAASASHNGFDVLAAMGGDGTLSEVVNGLMQARERGAKTTAKLAAIPSGTGNDFIGGSRLFEDWQDALLALVNPSVCNMDVLHFADSGGFSRYVINSFGVGYDAYVVKRVMELGARKIGNLSYMFEALRGLFYFKPGTLSVSVDEGPGREYERTWIFAVTNSEKFGGGMTVCPGALPDDGLLDFAFLHGVPRKNLPGLVFKVRGGKHIGKPGVVRGSARSITVNAPEGFPCHIDGDTVDVRFPVTVRVLKGVLPFTVKGEPR
ncbi:MAG: diacylglycerol/lipid kinase family protein [Bacillota bacterium]